MFSEYSVYEKRKDKETTQRAQSNEQRSWVNVSPA